jgi:hypothetical protein
MLATDDGDQMPASSESIDAGNLRRTVGAIENSKTILAASEGQVEIVMVNGIGGDSQWSVSRTEPTAAFWTSHSSHRLRASYRNRSILFLFQLAKIVAGFV